MILAYEQDVRERYFLFSQGSNGADKNEFCLQPSLFVDHKR